MHELGGLLATSGKNWDGNPIDKVDFADLLLALLRKEITGRTAKHILSVLFHGDKRGVATIIEQEHLQLIPLDDSDYRILASSVLERYPDIVEQIRVKGQTKKIQFLVGQMIREGEEGRVEAMKCEEFLNLLL